MVLNGTNLLIMKKISLKKLFQLGLVSNFSVVRVNNANGYPYVTMLQGDKSNNVYFGKESAKTALMHVGKKIAELLVTSDIVEVANEDGEQRFKIALEGKSDYVSTSELASLFGVEEVAGDFNTADFVAEFSSRDSQPNPQINSTLPTKEQYDADYAELQSQLALAKTAPAKAKVNAKIAKLEEVGHA